MKRLLFFGTLALLALAVMAFRAVEGPAGYVIGDTAADFNLKNVDGTMHSLSGTQGAKGYIVVFTCNACPYAQAYEDRIIALDKTGQHTRSSRSIPMTKRCSPATASTK